TNTSATTQQFTFDTTAPTATVSSPTAAQFRSALAAVTGTASDSAGIASVSIKIQKTGNANGYWTTGSSFAANTAGATALTATTANGFATWSADTSGVTFADGQSYTITVTTTGSAHVSTTVTSEARSRYSTCKTTAPTATVSSPTVAQFRSPLAAVTGTASDNAGVGSVSIKIQKTGNANGYWTSFFFIATTTTDTYALSLHDALPILTWSADTSGVTFADGQSYTITVT